MVLPRVASALMASAIYASAVMAQVTPELDECGKLAAELQKQSGEDTTRSVPYELVKQCYLAFPADPEFKAQHIKEIKPFIETYPFADMYLSPPGPPRTFGAPGIDPLKELDRFAADESLTTQYDFYTKISNMANSFEDAHFYYIPFCMAAFIHRQPFRLGAVYPNANGEPVIKVVATAPVSPVWDEALGTSDLSTFLNYTVKSIDGIPAAESIQNYSDRYGGFARSADSRFNAAVSSKIFVGGEFVLSQGYFSDTAFLPSDAKPRTYVLTPPVRADGTQPADITVTVPWASFPRNGGIPRPFANNAEYYGYLCLSDIQQSALSRRDVKDTTQVLSDFGSRPLLPRTTTPAGALDAAHTIPEISNAVLAEALQRHHAHHLERRQTPSGEPIPLVANLDTAFYVLEDGITGVWVFATVSPESSYDNWLGTITGGLRAFEQIGVKRLIIDVTANGGGDFCASTAFAEYILQNTPMIEDQLRLTPAVKALLKVDFFGIESPFSDIVPVSGRGSNIVAEAYTQDRGNGPQLLSGRFRFCQSAGSTPAGFIRTFNLPELERGWAPEDVSVVSDGGCGSACACMIRSMRDAHPGFKAYTYGGRSGKPYTPTSFEGGIVVPFRLFEGYYPEFDLLTEEERALLPGNITARFLGGLPITQGYSPLAKDTGYPAEWIPQPSDEHLVIFDPTDKKSVWDAVAKKMRVPGPPLPRTKLVALTTTATATATTATLPSTSESVATATWANPPSISASTATGSEPTATDKPHPRPYGVNAGNHAGWNYDGSNNAYAGGAYNPQNNPTYTKPGAVAYGGSVPSIKPSAVTAAYAALTSKAAAAKSTSKSAGNVYVNAAASAKGWWAAVGAIVGTAVAVLAL
ncbi:hypothetical protein HDU96_008771 [Phlyctochytrium bullatum]|nr:hypothetical protein HDU96_008771 [Phlyctochytrium bullatum]